MRIVHQVPTAVIMGEHDRETTFAAWCQKDPDHRLPEAMIREIAELRSELGS